MSMYISTNVSSLNAQRNFDELRQVAGYLLYPPCFRPAYQQRQDDAAGLQISSRMTSQINGLDQGNRNANDGISMAPDRRRGYGRGDASMLQRMRTLAQQSANDTNSDDDRAALQKWWLRCRMKLPDR